MGDSGAVSLHCVSCRAQHAEPGWLYAPTKNLFMKFAPSLKTYSTTWVVTFSCYTFGTCSWSSRKRKMALTRQSESSGRFSNVRKDKDAPSSSTCHHSAPTSSFLTLLFSYFSSPPSPPSSITSLLHHHPPPSPPSPSHHEHTRTHCLSSSFHFRHHSPALHDHPPSADYPQQPTH